MPISISDILLQSSGVYFFQCLFFLIVSYTDKVGFEKSCSTRATMKLTTKNSVLSTLSFPSVSNMLKAIRNPDWGSKNKNRTYKIGRLGLLTLFGKAMCGVWQLHLSDDPKLWGITKSEFDYGIKQVWRVRMWWNEVEMGQIPLKDTLWDKHWA